MSILLLPPRIDMETAARLFWRPRTANLFGLLRPHPVKRSSDGLPSSLELIWMPTYAFRIMLTRGGKVSHAWVSTDANYGGFALFERVGELTQQEPEGEVFPPILDADAAEKEAREGLLKYIMRRRSRKPDMGPTEEVRLFYAPVWVYYFRLWGRKIDLAVRDGYTGDPMGGRVRIAFLEALIRKKQSRAER